MEFNEELKNRDTEKHLKKEEIFAPVMSPSWSKSSRNAKKAVDHKEGSSSLKEKVKKIFS